MNDSRKSIVCESCGKTFYLGVRARTSPSTCRVCRQKALSDIQKAERRAKPKRYAVCEICGATYEQRLSTQRYCSPGCREVAQATLEFRQSVRYRFDRLWELDPDRALDELDKIMDEFKSRRR
jgi:protein-arginine kinase activator protein McsA